MADSLHSPARYEDRLGSTVTVGEGDACRDYELERLLGSGSTSAVYAARPRRRAGAEPAERQGEPARVAIKILHSSFCRNRAVVRRFLREIHVSKVVSHRSIVKVHGDGVCDGAVFLVLDLLDGETLEERRVARGGRLPVGEVLGVADALASALAAVHASGIVHRDLKPQNVFVTTSNELKLLDFGTARLLTAEPGEPVSVEGLVIGTPSFMSPEQARGERSNIDARSDIWSLGATLFTTLSGEYVHVGRDAHQRLLAAATRPPRSIASVARDLDPRVAAVVDRALAFDKAERWPDVQAMRDALAAARSAKVDSAGT